MYPKTSLESTANGGIPLLRISQLVPEFIRHGQVELSMSPETLKKYQECLDWVVRHIGDLEVTILDSGHITLLKQKLMERGVGQARIANMVFALKSFLRFCKNDRQLNVLDHKQIKSPKRERREVEYLTTDEVKQFVDSIKIETRWHNSKKGRFINIEGLRFRTLVEVLLGTGMRISEALSLDRNSINFETKEAKIIGKGNKQRTVFFTNRALYWVKTYLDLRQDSEQALFITQRLTRISRCDVSGLFRRYSSKSGISKKITPHILRHTTATTLLFNGCPIGHIKDILGHDKLETTCRYYLGLDKRQAKQAHGTFLNF